MATIFTSPSHDALQTVFLDRDGVINEKMPEGQYVQRWEEFRILPKVLDSIQILNSLNIRVIIVSNQRGVSLGLYSAEDVRRIHEAFQRFLDGHGAHVDGFYFCPHEEGKCNCRKPLPGLFEQAVADFPQIKAATSVMIGDSRSDIEFGRRLGMKTAFIDGQSQFQKPDGDVAQRLADFHHSTLHETVCGLLGGVQL